MNRSKYIFFGKYKGQSYQSIKEQDPGYLMWVRNNCDWLDDPSELLDAIAAVFNVTQELMPDQAQAADEVTKNLLDGNNRVHRLQGGAGYGKSYVVTEIAKRALKRGLMVTGIANSYVATQVLAQSLDPVGVRSATIASALRLAPSKDKMTESYGPSPDTATALFALLSGDSLLIIDEYSMCSDMVSNLVYEAMNTEGSEGKLLVVGDNKQLPSPEQDHMCAFDVIEPYSELTVPKRFDPDSTLHVLEQRVRIAPWELSNHLNAVAINAEVTLHSDTFALARQMLSDMEAYPKESGLMLFYKRADVAKANRLIRSAVYGDAGDEIEEGERLRIMRTTFVPHGDEHLRFYSGTFITAREPGPDSIAVRFDRGDLPGNDCPSIEISCTTVYDEINGVVIPVIFSKTEQMADPDMVGGKAFNQGLAQVRQYCLDNDHIKGVWKLYHHYRSMFLQVSYGYATTVHRSQGASVDRIYLNPRDILQGGRSIAPRLAYVAATRAKKEIHYTL